MTSKICVPRYVIDGSSDLWVRKILAWFRLYDTDKRGVLGTHELEGAFVERISKWFSEDQIKILPGLGDKIWNHLYSPCTRSIDGEKFVKWEDFLKSRFNQVFNHPEEERKYIYESQMMFMDLFDDNHDGKVTVDEQMCGARVWGMTEYNGSIMIAVMDKNGDGVLSAEEAIDMFTRFHMSTEFDVGAYALGTLPADDLEVC